jgi:chromosome segregation ATPase
MSRLAELCDVPFDSETPSLLLEEILQSEGQRQDQLRESQQETSKWHSQFKQVQAEVERLQRLQAASSSEATEREAQLIAEMQQQRTDTEDADAARQEALMERDALRAELARLQQSVEMMSAEHTQLGAAQEELQCRSSEVEQTNGELQALTERLSAAQAEGTAAQAEVVELRAMLASAQAALKQNEAGRAEAEQELQRQRAAREATAGDAESALNASLAAAEITMARLRQELDTARSTLSQGQEQVSLLTSERDEARRVAEQAGEAAEQAGEVAAHAQTQLQTLTGTFEAFRSQAAEQQSAGIAEVQANLDEAKHREAQLEQRLQEAQGEASRHNDTVDGLQRLLDEAQVALEAAHNEAAATTQKCISLEAEVAAVLRNEEALQAELRTLRDAASGSEENMAAITSALDEAQHNLGASRDELRALREEHAHLERRAAEAEAAAAGRVAELEASLNELRTTLHINGDDTSALKEQLVGLQSTIDRLQRRQLELTEAVRNAMGQRWRRANRVAELGRFD